MLKRKVMDSLLSWKAGQPKSLIIEGAGQVGKTYIVRAFARENYQTVYELNFLENPELKSIFSGPLQADQILMLIRMYFPDQPFIAGSCLIFLDEVQECPEAITALKFLTPDDRFDVIATGSALGMAFKQTTSYPVGYVEYLPMYSLDLEEFLWAKEIDDEIIGQLKDNFERRTKVHPALHNKMMGLLKEYLIIGEMPEVVRTFISSNDYLAADAFQRSLHRDYLADIALYAEPTDRIKAVACYKSIPEQLMKDNHKFQYSVVEKRGNARKFENSIDWLESAHFTATVNNVSKIEYPPENFVKDNNFRLYPTDIGLLMAMYDVNLKSAILLETDFEQDSNHLLLKIAKGGLYEALAADLLFKRGHSPFYFYRNDNSTLEIEFLLKTSDGMVPLEIKAGQKASPSLKKVLETDDVPYGYKFASQNVGVSQKLITMPLYMLMFI